MTEEPSDADKVTEHVRAGQTNPSQPLDETSPLIADDTKPADETFVRKLIAAVRMKDYLLEQGFSVKETTIKTLNALATTFESEIALLKTKTLDHRQRTASDSNKMSWWPKVWR